MDIQKKIDKSLKQYASLREKMIQAEFKEQSLLMAKMVKLDDKIRKLYQELKHEQSYT